MKERQIVLKQDILKSLNDVGLRKGQTVIVHTSLSSLGFVCGGAYLQPNCAGTAGSAVCAEAAA